MLDHPCDTCSRDFPSWTMCRHHMDDYRHWRWPYECDTCTARYADKYSAERHMEDKDHFAYPFDCETCRQVFRYRSDRDDHQWEYNHYKHRHCRSCDRYFDSSYLLEEHMNSCVHQPGPSRPREQYMRPRVQQSADVPCPFCGQIFTVASGVSHHLESAACPEALGLTRSVIHQRLSERDTSGIITERLIESTTIKEEEDWDAEHAFNGEHYVCYICHRQFKAASSLRQHVDSLVHQAPMYHCPNTAGKCHGKKLPSLGALLNHLESESCGYVKFASIQRNVNNLFTGTDRRLITR